MRLVDVERAKSSLQQLVREIEAKRASEIVISRGGCPVARLVPVGSAPHKTVRYGVLKGRLKVHDDFDAADPKMERPFYRGDA